MMVVLSSVSVALGIFIVLLTSIRAPVRQLSLFELRRRKHDGDKKAADMLQREELVALSRALSGPVVTLLFVILVLCLVELLGTWGGVLTSALIGLFYRRVASLGLMQKVATWLSRRYESHWFDWLLKHKKALRLIAGKPPLVTKTLPLGSRHELAYLIEASPAVFKEQDAKLVKRTLDFKDLVAGDVMTKKSAIIAIKHDELLGPLVLDDLHKTGHTIFPVMEGGEIIGLLDSSGHRALRIKESAHVRDVMDTDLTRIGQNQPLVETLKTLVNTRQPLLVVVNDERRSVGIISMGDVLQALMGEEFTSLKG